jgi:hypothetical protein
VEQFHLKCTVSWTQKVLCKRKIINSSRTYFATKHLNLNILEKKFRLLGKIWAFTHHFLVRFGLGSGKPSPAFHNPD